MFGPRSPTPSSDLRRFAYRRDLALSRREQQILWLMCQGWLAGEIAAQLSRAPTTIRTHRERIYRKTGCRTQVQLGVWAVRHGLVRR